jgi:hypothetical protein
VTLFRKTSVLVAVVVAMVFAALVGSVGSASAAPAAPAAVTCPPGVFCGWEFDNFTGSHFTQSKCGVKVPIPSGWWIATGGAFQGSYWNNQTGHAVARFYNSNGNEVRPSSTAVQKVSTFAWGSPITTVRVAYVIVC